MTDLYREFDGNPLWAPNDLVFDDQGGFYFTDHGLTHERDAHVTGIYYGKADGSMVKEIVFPAHEPNGIGLSPDGTKLYWAETWTGRIMQRDIVGPGEVVETSDRRHVGVPLRLPGLPAARLAGRRQRRQRAAWRRS